MSSRESGTPVTGPIGFESPFPVAVSQIGAREWELTAPLVYHGNRRIFTAPVGSTTDFASVPQSLRGLIRFDEVASAVFHDRLWRYWVPHSAGYPATDQVTYRDADGLLRQALMAQNVGLLRRWIIWAGVRLGALARPGGRHQWWRDAPAVLGISLLMLPVALLPTPIGLALLGLAERVVSPLDRRRHQLQAERRQLRPINSTRSSTIEEHRECQHYGQGPVSGEGPCR